MNKGIILHSIVPLRGEGSECAEQLTQLLFGETVEILEEAERWIRVRNDADGMEGWVDFKMLTKMSIRNTPTIERPWIKAQLSCVCLWHLR